MQTDQILKEFWEDNDRFADFFNTVCFGGRQVIHPEELESIPADLSDAEEKEQKLEGITKYRDKAKIWKGTIMVILGLENQDKIHYAMPERVMLNDALQYENQRKKTAAYHRKKKDLRDDEFLSGFAKTDRLYPVVTVVIYYGENPWDGPKSLREMVELPEELEPHFADYPMHLFQILGNDGRDFTNEDLRTVLRNADALRSGRVQDMDRMIDAELVKYLAAFVNSEKVMKLLQNEKGEIAVCTALEEMIRDGERRGRAIGKEEGRAEGRTEGKAEGKAEDIIELLRELGTVPDELEKTIIGEKNIEVLREWLKKAARAESVAQFQEEIHFRDGLVVGCSPVS